MNYKQIIGCCIAFLLGLFIAISIASAEVSESERIECPVYLSLTEEERVFIDKLDELREQRDLPKITLVSEIVEDSRRWSKHMNRTKRIYHGAPFENCASGMETGARVFSVWRGSPGHNAKLLSRNDQYGGIGRDGVYWTYRAVSTMENYHRGEDPESDLAMMRTASASSVQYKTVYRTQRGPLGLVRRQTAVRVPVTEEDAEQ